MIEEGCLVSNRLLHTETLEKLREIKNK